MRAVLLFACATACGTSPPVAEPSSAVPEGAVGCVSDSPDADPDSPDRLLITRSAELLEVTVSPAELRRAIENVRVESGLEEDELWQAIEDEGSTEEDYRADLGRALLHLKVLSTVASPHYSAGELDREYESTYGNDPNENPETRAMLMRPMYQRQIETAQREALDSLRSYWQAVRVEENGTCVERFPVLDAELPIDGNVEVEEEVLRELLTADGPSRIAPGWILPPNASGRVLAHYYDRGFVEARVRLVREDDEIALQIEEGPEFTLTRVYVVDGETQEDVDDALIEGIDFGVDQPFSRTRLEAGIQLLRGQVQARRGGTPTVVPEVDLDRIQGTVEITLAIQTENR